MSQCAGRAAALLALMLAATSGLAAQSSPPSISWRELAGSGVRVRFASGDSLAAVRALAFLTTQPPLPALPPGVPPEAIVYLAPDEPTFLDLTGGLPDWGAGVAIPESHAIVVPAYPSSRRGEAVGVSNATLRHEWAHLGLDAYLEGFQIPRWLDEGYALWAEGGFDASEAWRLRILLALGRTPPLDSLTLEWPRDRASAEAAYLLAGSAVAYLTEESGERGFRLLLERWRADGSLPAALARTYGIGPDQLEEDWRAWVRKRYGWLFVLSHSLVLWSALTVLLMLLSFGRRRHQRRRMAMLRASEPADDPAYWMDPPQEAERPPD